MANIFDIVEKGDENMDGQFDKKEIHHFITLVKAIEGTALNEKEIQREIDMHNSQSITNVIRAVSKTRAFHTRQSTKSKSVTRSSHHPVSRTCIVSRNTPRKKRRTVRNFFRMIGKRHLEVVQEEDLLPQCQMAKTTGRNVKQSII